MLFFSVPGLTVVLNICTLCIITGQWQSSLSWRKKQERIRKTDELFRLYSLLNSVKRNTVFTAHPSFLSAPVLYTSYCTARSHITPYTADFLFFPIFNHPLSFTVEVYSWQMPVSPTVEKASRPPADHNQHLKPILRRSRVTATAPPRAPRDRMMKGWGKQEIEAKWRIGECVCVWGGLMRIYQNKQSGEMWRGDMIQCLEERLMRAASGRDEFLVYKSEPGVTPLLWRE